jgi:hypothetical protein
MSDEELKAELERLRKKTPPSRRERLPISE